ncbi:hypothetical protein BSKO_14023 [Bryopsis sp. KO-2023]|nr:hypothetical protein BSKO_14023 [Bryopsis sp. KO-2023]
MEKHDRKRNQQLGAHFRVFFFSSFFSTSPASEIFSSAALAQLTVFSEKGDSARHLSNKYILPISHEREHERESPRGYGMKSAVTLEIKKWYPTAGKGDRPCVIASATEEPVKVNGA